MKKLYIILILLVTLSLNSLAQAPEKMSYQTVIRDASNLLVTNQTIGIQISILHEEETVYLETHTEFTNSNGLLSIEIGTGTTTDDFSQINWGKGSFFIKTEIDPTGGDAYTITGVNQLLSVPYSFHAGGLTLTSPNGESFTYSTDDFGNLSINKSDALPRERLIERATFVFNNLELTDYTHSSGSIMDEENGIYFYDCSGFISEFVIKECLADHHADLLEHTTSSTIPFRPLATDFYDYFRNEILGPDYDPNDSETCVAELNGWHVFTNVEDLRKGDLIIAKYDEDWNEIMNNYTTGHTMIAWSSAIQDAVDPLLYKIKILDAAGSGHSLDTRDTAPSTTINGKGIGIGWMVFKNSTSVSQRAVQYKWTFESGMFYRSFSTYFYSGDSYERKSHDRLKGIIFARPIED